MLGGILCECRVERHDIGMRRPCMYHIFSLPNVVGHIVDMYGVMFVESIMFKHNPLPISQYFTVPHLVRTDSARTPSWPWIPSGVRVES